MIMTPRVFLTLAVLVSIVGCAESHSSARQQTPVPQDSVTQAEIPDSKPSVTEPAEPSTPLTFEEQYPWDVPDGFTRLTAYVAVKPVSDPPRCSDARDHLCVFYEVITNVEDYPDDCSVSIDVVFVDESNRIVDDAWDTAKVPMGLVRIFELGTRETTAVDHQLLKASCFFSKGHPLLEERESSERK